MIEALRSRLEQMTMMVDQKKQQLNQLNADLNVLIGQATELTNVIAMHEAKEKSDAEVKDEVEDEVPSVEEIADAICEVV